MSMVVNPFLSGAAPVAGGAWVDRSVDYFVVGASQEVSGTLTSFQKWFPGYIDSLRVTKGIARYTSTHFTAPTAEFPNDASDPYWDDVVTLLRFDGTDGATTSICEKGNTVTHNGGAALSTSVKKFGTASCLFDGVNDWVKVQVGTTPQALGTTFTIEAWVQPTARVNTGYGAPFMSCGPVSQGGLDTDIAVFGPNGYFQFAIWGPGASPVSAPLITTNRYPVPLNDWTHLAVTRDGGTGLYWLHVNGNLATFP